MTDSIELYYQRQEAIYQFLVASREVSFAQDVEQAIRKNLALAASSFFEQEVVDIVCGFTSMKSSGCNPLVSFVRNKALKRQFHSLFDWEKGKNANGFFSLFGEDFKADAESEVKSDARLAESVKAFLELGHLRNCIVHQNYADFVSDKTSVELLATYRTARIFVDYLRKKLV